MTRARPVLIALLACASLGGVAQASPPVAEQNDANWARDGNIAIMEELVAARKAGTVEAYDLFIARHPDHPLAETARAERQRLEEARRRR